MYAIEKNKFAPKCAECQDEEIIINSHGITYQRCNFKCTYCELRNRPTDDFKEYNEEEFANVVEELLKYGNGFKFTGGEPTLNKNLKRDVQIVRSKGGRIYLDTNGSNPKIINELLDSELIDVIGLSLKGLDCEQSIKCTQIDNERLCWENVIEVLKNSVKFEKLRVIVTYVVTNNDNLYETFERLDTLLRDYKNVYLKINNLMENNETRFRNLKKVDEEEILLQTKNFLIRHPEYKGRIILILSDLAVSKYKEIKFC